MLHILCQKNLLSGVKIEKQHYKIEFDVKRCLIKDKKNQFKVVAEGIKDDDLYSFTATVAGQQTNS